MKIGLVDSGLGLVSLLKKIVDNKLKHQIDLLFTNRFPLGICSLDELNNEVKDLERRIKLGNYDLVIIMCNTLSTVMRNQNYIKILDYNKKYLDEHKEAFPIGTKMTINYLNKGYIDNYLASDIEEDNLKHIIYDIHKWPIKKEYLLCCTHYALVENIIKMIHKESKVVDLTNNLFEDLLLFPQDEKLQINYNGKEEKIIKYLEF